MRKNAFKLLSPVLALLSLLPAKTHAFSASPLHHRTSTSFGRTLETAAPYSHFSSQLSSTPRSAAHELLKGGGSAAVSTSLAGRLWPAIKKFRIGPEKFKEIVKNIKAITDWHDLVFLSIFAFGSLPLVRYSLQRMKKAQEEAGEEDWETELDNDFLEEVKEDITLRKRYRIAKLVSRVAQLALSVYAADVLNVVFTTLGFQFSQRLRLSTLYAKVSYTSLFLVSFLEFKKLALCGFFRVKPDDMGRVEILNRLLDGVSVTVVSLLFLDWIQVRMGIAAKSIFALSSVGTLTLSLASKDIVASLLSGIFLTASNKMYVGDNVRFGDGTTGKVIKLGWLETTFRGGDNVVTRVPNTLLSNQKVSNVSRVRQSQVKQTLRFHYDAADKIPAVCQSIRSEIKASCPRLIKDNSRPFRVFWTDINEDHLEVMVDTHFNIAPIGDAYWQNRQAVLMAIRRAIKKHHVELAQLVTIASFMGDEPEQRVLPKAFIPRSGDDDDVDDEVPETGDDEGDKK